MPRIATFSAQTNIRYKRGSNHSGSLLKYGGPRGLKSCTRQETEPAVGHCLDDALRAASSFVPGISPKLEGQYQSGPIGAPKLGLFGPEKQL